MQRTTIRSNHFFLCIIFLGLTLLTGACTPFGLKVEQVSNEGELLSVRAPDCSYGGKIKSIEALDKFTVRFALCSPDPAFLEKIASPVFAIQDQDYLSSHNGDSMAMSQSPNGTGPYKLKQFSPGGHVILEVNPDYWGVPAKDDTLIFRWASVPIERLTALQIRWADISDRPDPNSYNSIREDSSLTLISRPILNVSYLAMNNEHPPFNDERVRRAISFLLDRQKIVDDYYPLGTDVADQFIPPTMGLGYTPGYNWLDYNPKEGMDLLEEAGFDFNQILELTYSDNTSDYLPLPKQIAQEIQSQLADAGIKVNLIRKTHEDFQRAEDHGELALYLSGWNADFPDPANFYSTHFASDFKSFGHPYSDIGFMAKEAGNLADPQDRESRYNRINELIKLHVPAIPLAHGGTAVVSNSEVQGLVVGPMHENFEEVVTSTNTLRIIQTLAPESLWPGDEVEKDTLRITRLIYDTLVEYETGSTGIKPSLAEYWESNSNLTEWTFTLRYGVKFNNGADLEANDVVATFAALWDAANPNHTGRTGQFTIFKNLFGEFLNASNALE